MTAIHLDAAFPALDAASLKRVEAVAWDAEQRALRRGDVLVQQGDPSDALYFVLSGRFSVHVDGRTSIAEIGQGEPIGEIGFFAGTPRTATVVATRDSTVLTITRERFEMMNEAVPAMRDAVIVSLARRLSDNISQAARRPAARTIAVLAAGGSNRPDRFIGSLCDVFASASRAVFLTADAIAAQFPGRSLDEPAVSGWLNSREIDCDFVFYLADQALTDWTMKCIRQADTVFLVATAGAPTNLNDAERFAWSVHPPSARRLIVLHKARSVSVAGTASWLAAREVLMHHHVALDDDRDVQRLFRFVSGSAVGFVAGGGGALGCAHLGVYKAFSEAGTDFDILGGTSAGAAMMAGLACGMGPERADEGTHNIFVRSRAFRRLTVPRYGLIDHKVFDRALKAEYGDVAIEDLWKPFFAISSNLTDNRPQLHFSGPIWQAVRASGSVPGVLPPFFTGAGEMLVDGSLMDNVPLAQMKALKTGPNVVVRLRVRGRTVYKVDYDSIPGPRQLIGAMMNPWRRRRLPRIPGVVQVISLGMLATAREELQLDGTDTLVTPEFPKDLRFTSWERHTEVFLHAYHWATSWLQTRQDTPRRQAAQ